MVSALRKIAGNHESSSGDFRFLRFYSLSVARQLISLAAVFCEGLDNEISFPRVNPIPSNRLPLNKSSFLHFKTLRITNFESRFQPLVPDKSLLAFAHKTFESCTGAAISDRAWPLIHMVELPVPRVLSD